MYLFPDETHLPRSADGSEPILGGSVGLNRILIHLRESSVKSAPEFGGIAISLRTILRNVYSTDKTKDGAALDALMTTDVSLLMRYYNAHLGNILKVPGPKKFRIVIYGSNYAKVPKDCLRDDSREQLHLEKLYRRIVSRNSVVPTAIGGGDFVECTYVPLRGLRMPHVEIADAIRSHIIRDPHSAFGPMQKIGLISHVPIDYHAAGLIDQIWSFESYTGKVRPRSEFGLKIAKEGVIPFNGITHYVFGDKLMIRSQLKRGDRPKLLERAEKEHWVSKSKDQLTDILSKQLGISSSELRKNDLSRSL